MLSFEKKLAFTCIHVVFRSKEQHLVAFEMECR